MKTILALIFALILTFPAMAQDPIKVGYIGSFTVATNYIERGQHATEMAIEEFNAAGGLDGRMIELIVRDDRGSAADGVQIAQELVNRDGVDLLIGMSYSFISKAIYEYAEHAGVPYFAVWCSSEVCKKQDPGYTFSYEQSYDLSGKILAKEAATYPITKWGIVRNTDAWSVAITEPFIEELQRLRPDVEIVANIASPLGKVKGNVIAQKLRSVGAEGVYVTMLGGDLTNYIRAQKQLGILDEYKHIHAYFPPEELLFLKEEAPVGWYALGYPERELNTPEHIAFIDAYEDKYNTNPGLSGILSYAATKHMLASLKAAGSVKATDVIEAARTTVTDTPVGSLRVNPETNLGTFSYWYGYIELKDGKPVMTKFDRIEEIE